MNQNLAKIQKIAVPIMKKSGIKRSAIFGSFARDDAGKNSDIDFLIEFKPDVRASLFTLSDLKFKLKRALKREVDLLDFGDVHPLLKRNIQKDKIKIL